MCHYAECHYAESRHAECRGALSNVLLNLRVRSGDYSTLVNPTRRLPKRGAPEMCSTRIGSDLTNFSLDWKG